jgi:hypothetical protein
MKYSPELLMALVIEGLEVLRSTGKQITGIFIYRKSLILTF